MFSQHAFVFKGEANLNKIEVSLRFVTGFPTLRVTQSSLLTPPHFSLSSHLSHHASMFRSEADFREVGESLVSVGWLSYIVRCTVKLTRNRA